MTILRTHHHDGTVGTTASSATEGYDTFSGTNPTYVASGITNQALEWTSGAAAAYFQDNVAGGYILSWVKIPTLPGSDLAPILMLDSSSVNLGAVVITSAGKVTIYSGLTTLQATSTTTLTAGTWYWLAWHCDGGSQELRIGVSGSATPVETITGSAAAGVAGRYRIGNPWTGKRGATGNTIDLDEVQVGDAWISPNFNTAPTANAGPDQTNVAAGATVTLNGTGSTDPEGDALTYAWTQTAGTSVTLSSATVAQPTFTAPSIGSAQTLTFSLVVTDINGAASVADTVNIGVLAAINEGSGPVLQNYTCDGTPNAIVTNTNTGFSSITGNIVFNSTGTAIEVSDGVQAFGQDQTIGDYCAIWFSVPALPSTADECIAQAMNGTTSLASIRIKSDGTISIYSGLGTLVATTAASISSGTKYRLEWNTRTDGQELRLFSNHGSTPIETITGAVASALATNQRRFGHPQASAASGIIDIYQITINSGWPNAVNIAPVANAGADQSDVAAGSVVTLDGSKSIDQDADPISYSWVQISGDSVVISDTTAINPTFVAPSTSNSQTLTFSLIVSDDHGATSSADTVNINVLAVPFNNLRLRVNGAFVSAVEKVRIAGVWTVVSDTVLSTINNDDSVFNDAYSDSY